MFNDIEGNITKKSTHAFSFLVGKHREPQSINAKLCLPIMPIGLVAYALTLLWDNLCRNSCMFSPRESFAESFVYSCADLLALEVIHALTCDHTLLPCIKTSPLKKKKKKKLDRRLFVRAKC